MPRSIGGTIILIGVVLVVAGLLVRAGGLSWLGRLPGDIRIERDNVRVYLPITTMIVVSVALTLLSWIIRRFF